MRWVKKETDTYGTCAARGLVFSSLFAALLLLLGLRDAALSGPPNRVNVGGLGDLVTEIAGPGSSGITAVSPAGDVDGDGLDDILIRFASAEKFGDIAYDDVVLLYGFPSPGGPIDVLDPSVRKSVIRTYGTEVSGDPEAPGSTGVAGGQDVNGDRVPDLLVANTYENTVQDSAVLLILGGALPEQIDGSLVGDSVPGSFIFFGPLSFGEPFGGLVALSEDLNGDGLGEILVWSRLGGKLYVLFGEADPPLKLDASRAGDIVPGFRFEAARNTLINRAKSIGDVDGDGFADLAIECSGSRDPVSLLIYGRPTFPSLLRQDDPPETFGAAFPNFKAIEGAGDVSGDGRAEILLALEENGTPARVYLLDGRPQAQLSGIVDADTIQQLGPRAVLTEPYDATGATGNTGPVLSLVRGRDLDGDRRPEVLLGVPNRTLRDGPAVGAFAGAAYLLRGAPAVSEQKPALATAESQGIVIDGSEPQGALGDEAFLPGDFTGDGEGDVLLVSRKDYCLAPGLRKFSFKLWLVSGRTLDPALPPRIGRIFPETGGTPGGESVLIHGTGFGSDSRVHFGGQVSPSVSVLGSGVIVAETPPARLPARVGLRVEVEPGNFTAPLDFSYEHVQTVPIGEGSERAIEMRFAQLAPLSLLSAVTGDFNGDSRRDVAVLQSHDGGAKSKMFVVFGDGTRAQDVIFDDLVLPQGIALGFSEGRSGTALASGGDLDDDGDSDLVLRMNIQQPAAGSLQEWLLVAGRASFPEGVPIDALDRTTRIFSSSDEVQFVGAAAIVRDATGDGIDDLLLSSGRQGGRTLLYIIKGSKTWPASPIDLDTLAEDGLGARLEVELSVTRIAGSLGDFNGDGVNDVFFGGRGVLQEGVMIIVYGGEAVFTGDTLRLTRGFFGDNGGLLIAGTSLFSGLVSGASAAGDIDGDGDADAFFYIDSYGGCTLAPRAGGGAVFDYGAALSGGIPSGLGDHLQALYAAKSTGLPDFMPAGPGIQSGVFYIENSVALEGLGSAAAAAGDFDGDGIADLVVGAPGLDTTEPIRGACYVLRGGRDIADEGRIVFPGGNDRVIRLSPKGEGTGLGAFLDAGFDWDKDGVADVLVASNDGRAYVVFGGSGESEFIRADADGDGTPRLTDAVVTLVYLFQGGLGLPCLDSADSNDDGNVNIADPIFTLSYLFTGGPAPPAPFPASGSDPTGDVLRCVR